MILTIVVSAVVFGCAAFLAMQIADQLGVRSGRKRAEGDTQQTQILVLVLTVCSALIGGLVAQRSVPIVPFVTLGVVCISLCAAWYSDITFGYIPDYFTLLPLGIVLIAAVVQHQSYFVLIRDSALAFLPFGIAAALSKGRGMGWGDSKLAALGGAVLGFQMALLTFAAACLALVAVGWLRGRRTEPLAFAPYLSVAIVFGVLVRAVFSAT